MTPGQNLNLFFDTRHIDLSSLRFPELRRARFKGFSSPLNAPDTPFVNFITAHPTITQLDWHPRDRQTRLPAGSLPLLKRPHTSFEFVLHLLMDGIPRSVESLPAFTLDAETLENLREIHGGQVRHLNIFSYDSLDLVHEVASLLPAVTHLQITNSHLNMNAMSSEVYPMVGSRFSLDPLISLTVKGYLACIEKRMNL